MAGSSTTARKPGQGSTHLTRGARNNGLDLPRRNSIPPFAALRAFDAVARLGGVRKAADQMGLDHAVISRHLRSLEEWTGTILVDRGHAGAVLTPEGKIYHRSVAEAIDLLSNATMNLLKQGDERQLRIWCTPGFLSKWLLSRISQFEDASKDTAIEVRPSDYQPDFNRHEAEIDIRYAPTYGPSIHFPGNVRTFELASPAVVPIASPEYLATHDTIANASDLLAHNLLHEESLEHWRAWLTANRVTMGQHDNGIRLWHAHLTVDAARQGRGIALTNRFLAHDELASGRVVEVPLQDVQRPVCLGSYLLFARTDRWSSYSIAKFRHWLTAQIAAPVG